LAGNYSNKGVFMKRITARFLGTTVVSALLCAVLAACGGSPARVSTADELDAAIRETSDYLNKQLPKGNKLVILNVQSEFPALSEYIIDELIANTVNDRVFSVVDRQQLNTIRAELDFQMSGEVDDATAQALGRMAGAQIIISGAVSRLGDLYRLRIRALSVQSAQIEAQFNRNIPDGTTIAALVKSQATGYGSAATASGASGAGSRTSASATATAATPAPAPAAAPAPVQAVPAQAPAPAPTPAPVPSSTIYKIGDKGPAGGIIFYDKGVFESGWQYLEAAPPEMEFKAQWGDMGDSISGTGIGVGQGKQNTQAIATHMQRKGKSGTAAQTCQQFSHRGYTDWFLPSQAELNLIYINLKKNGLGGFSNGWYWSSSQGNGDGAWAQRFNDGEQNGIGYQGGNPSNAHSVRAIRQF
jgi:hypothetical protein